MYYQSKGKELRQKAINLMYLIFLAFLFTYVPADFLDSVQTSGKSLDMLAKDAGKENTASAIYFLNLLKSDAALYEKTKSQFLAIEDYSQDVETQIENYKLGLISIDGIDSLGYFVNGKKEKTTGEIMLNSKQSDSLFATLKNYKKFILDYIGYEHATEVDNMLHTPSMIKKSDGAIKSIEQYYFSHTPLNVAITNFNHFRGSVERIKIYAYRKLIRDLVENNRSDLPLEVLQNFDKMDIQRLGNTKTLREFFEKVNNNENAASKESQLKNQSNLLIESVTDTIYPEGRPFKFQVHFDTSTSKRVTIAVTGPEESRSFSTSKPGPFIFLPATKGRYTITFKDGVKSVSKTIRVIDVEPLIQNTKLSTIYIGIDNALNIKTSEYGKQDQMVATITKGEIFRKGDKFYARVTEPGLVQIAIFAKMPYGVVKVAEQIFAVRSLNNPYAIVNAHPNNSEVNLSAIKNMRNLTVVTDEYLLDEQYFIQEFTASLIFNGHTQITKPFKNAGNSFNSYLIELLSKAKSGDKIMFTEIVAKSNLGNRIILNPYNLIIK
jgi:hypothetical protein